MYVPRGVPCSLVMILVRAPLLVVPLVLGLIFALPDVTPNNQITAMVSFTFDDGYISTYTEAFPILSKYCFVGTAFVITSKVGEPGYMNSEQLKELYSSGWEIGSHGVNHFNLTQLTDKEALLELQKSKQFLERLGFSVYSFASPYGEWNEKTLKLISQYYLTHRLAWPDGLNELPLVKEEDRYRLMAVSVKNNTSLESVKKWVLEAKKNGKWLILVFHYLGTDREHGEYSWSSQNFEELVKFVSEQGFKGSALSSQ